MIPHRSSAIRVGKLSRNRTDVGNSLVVRAIGQGKFFDEFEPTFYRSFDVLSAFRRIFAQRHVSDDAKCPRWTASTYREHGSNASVLRNGNLPLPDEIFDRRTRLARATVKRQKRYRQDIFRNAIRH